jgi:ABC-type Fe3+-hydroxamate transport system substrate-binding protein/adenosylcobinamide amidohydrolase
LTKRLVFKFLFPLFLFAYAAPTLKAWEITDDLGRKLDIPLKPTRVVSLSPPATEIILALGAEKSLAGVSVEDGHFRGLIGIPAVGTPKYAHWGLIEALKPDLLIVPTAMAQEALSGAWAGGAPTLALDGQGTLAGAERRALELGELFGQSEKARAILAGNDDYFETLALKTAKLKGPRKRVLRLLARDGSLKAPGDSSFQNELIRRAGGLTLALDGGIHEVEITEAEIAKFDPEVIYACGKDKNGLEALVQSEALRDIAAVRDHRVRYYPCALTDGAAAHAGYFAAWLSGGLYPDEYGDPANLARPNGPLGEKPVELGIPYVSGARVVSVRLNDYAQDTLLIDFKTPQTVISSSDGQKEGVTSVGNASSPPMVWDITHQGGWEADLAERRALLGLDPASSSLILTGADLDGLAVVTKTHEDLTVTALATGGAESNAIRSSKDVGAYYQPGTINVIVLSSRRLSPAGAALAMIGVTEAKTAALWDLDVRSSQTPLVNPATGTGTDSLIIVAGGEGQPLDYVGGHAKIGQLMAEAVHGAVLGALAKGNGLSPHRHVFARLAERGLDPLTLFTGPEATALTSLPDFQAKVALTLLEPGYAGLLESAMALDDAKAMGHVSDLGHFNRMAQAAAEGLAGGPVKILDLAAGEIPPALKTALNAIGSGLAKTRTD